MDFSTKTKNHFDFTKFKIAKNKKLLNRKLHDFAKFVFLEKKRKIIFKIYIFCFMEEKFFLIFYYFGALEVLVVVFFVVVAGNSLFNFELLLSLICPTLSITTREIGTHNPSCNALGRTLALGNPTALSNCSKLNPTSPITRSSGANRESD